MRKWMQLILLNKTILFYKKTTRKGVYNNKISLRGFWLGILLLSSYSISKSQFTTYTYGGAGYANPSAGVYKMTDDNGAFQVSAVWNNTSLNALVGFDMYFNVYLGCLDQTGADGMAFVLSASTGVGDGGANMGVYMNGGTNAPVMPNEIVLIEFDTWDNGASYGDIANDHIVGNKYNNSFCCPMLPPVDMGNMEDNLLHTVRIRYTPPAGEFDWDGGSLETFYYPVGAACPATPVFTYPVNIRSVANSTNVFWGWTASTGGNKNEQWFSYNGTSTPPIYTTGCTPLPLKLLNFNVINGKENLEALINWSAISTDQASRIELYRSTDAQNWQLVHNSNIHFENIYSEEVNDYLSFDGVYYYKLEMIDRDGIRTVSNIISISINARANNISGIYKIYLPYDKQRITIQSIESINWETCNVYITDMTGKEVLPNIKIIPINEHTAEIILPKYQAEGVYFVKCLCENNSKVPDIQRVY